MKQLIMYKKHVAGMLIITAALIGTSCFNDSDDNTVSFSDDSLVDAISEETLASLDSFDYSGEVSGSMDSIKNKLSSYTKTNFNVTKAASVKGLQSYKIQESNSAALDVITVKNSVHFTKKMESYNGIEQTAGLPADEDAPSLAQKHLAALNLVPDTSDSNDTFELAHVGGVAMASVDPSTGKTETYEKLKTVTYSRKLFGLPVVGASRIVVNMGLNGELTGLVYTWPQVKKSNILKSSIVSKANLKLHIVDKIKKFYCASSGKGITIKNLKLVMYDDGNGVIEPALCAFGEVLGGDSSKYDSDWIIPLLSNYKGSYSIDKRPSVSPQDPAISGK